ncbi:MAG: DUF1838 family protein [Chromatiales bacterium]|jgi:hypothetical protein|nr:DUF1838 family protein [Chromatiales bacterium]
MQTTRRDVLSFASVGALGASTLALMAAGQARAAATASSGGTGPAIKGPYLDLTTGKGNQLAYARIQGDLDWGKQKYFWFKGYVSAVQPGKKIVDLCGALGFGAIRLNGLPDGNIQRMCREIILYTDLRSGEVIDEWQNPLTSERVKVVHVDNDPFNYMIEPFFPAPPSFGGLNKEAPPPRIPFVLPWYQHGDWLEMETHIHLAYPSALQPDKWPRESAGPIAQVSEYFAHHVKAEDMQNEKLTTVDYRGTWNRITPWLPWMLMGQAPGHVQYNCFMGTTTDLSQIFSRQVLDVVDKRYAKYYEAPKVYTAERSLSSLERYAEEQKPQPPKAM